MNAVIRKLKPQNPFQEKVFIEVLKIFLTFVFLVILGGSLKFWFDRSRDEAARQAQLFDKRIDAIEELALALSDRHFHSHRVAMAFRNRNTETRDQFEAKYDEYVECVMRWNRDREKQRMLLGIYFDDEVQTAFLSINEKFGYFHNSISSVRYRSEHYEEWMVNGPERPALEGDSKAAFDYGSQAMLEIVASIAAKMTDFSGLVESRINETD